MNSNSIIEGTIGESPNIPTAADENYQLLLHSLTHDHTESNVDRHVLLFEKWCRDYVDGVYICHLKYVIKLLQILRERVELHSALFLPLVPSVLKVLSKVILPFLLLPYVY
jgi:hypothetical protein